MSTALKLENLTREQKLAIVILAMGVEQGSDILRKMPRSEAERVIRQINGMPRVEKAFADLVLKEFKNLVMHGKTNGIDGGVEVAEQLLQAAFKGRDYTDFLGQLKQTTPWRFKSLEGVDGKMLAKVIVAEHPQTIALVLAQADSEVAANCLKYLPENMRAPLLERIARLDVVEPQLLEELDEQLSLLVKKHASRTTLAVGGAEKAAKLLQTLARDSQDALLEQLQMRDPAIGESIRGLMFTFDDIVRVPLQQMPVVHREVAAEWTVALRGAKEEVKQHVLASLSTRSAQMLQEELKSGRPRRQEDIEIARRRIVEKIKALESQGKITIPKSGEVFL